MSEIENLRDEWTTLCSHTLPKLAEARDSAQRKWPVTLDHCFVRIILDNTIGHGLQRWDNVLQKPAGRNMDEQQLRDAIKLGQRIQSGEVSLCHLDEVSLRCRGNNEWKYGSESVNKPVKSTVGSQKRTAKHMDDPTDNTRKKLKTEKYQSTLQFQSKTKPAEPHMPSSTEGDEQKKIHQNNEHLQFIIRRIQSHPTLTPYRKKLYTTLLSVPRGRYTTYAAMSAYLGSSARAVGNGMRNNPFAPEVPCHRVLAADRSIGGFHGEWGKDGKYAAKKIGLLRGEGVRFDGSGKVVGVPFRDFHTFQDLDVGVPEA